MQAGNNCRVMHDKKQRKIVDLVVSQLLAVRKEKKLSHETVSNLAKLHRSTVSYIESGKAQPTLLTLLKISNALECDLYKMLAKAEKEQKSN